MEITLHTKTPLQWWKSQTNIVRALLAVEYFGIQYSEPTESEIQYIHEQEGLKQAHSSLHINMENPPLTKEEELERLRLMLKYSIPNYTR